MTDADDPATGQEWAADGVDLAKALVARSRAGGSGPSQQRRSSRGKRSRQRYGRRNPGSGWSGPGADDRDPQQISAVVDRMATEHGWDDDLAVHGVVARWGQIVGRDINEHVQPEHYDDGVLTVRADSTAWATQMRMLAAQLMKRLNDEIGAGSVVRIEVRGPQSRSWRKGPRSVPGRGPRDTYG